MRFTHTYTNGHKNIQNEKLPQVQGKVVFLCVEQLNNEQLPYVHGKVVFLHVEQSKNEKLLHVHGTVVFLHVEQSKKKSKKQMTLADNISSKTTFDKNLAIRVSLRFTLSITISLS